MPTLTIKARLSGPEDRFDALKSAMLSATKVYNGILWNLRDEYEREGKNDLSMSGLNRIARSLPRHKELYSDIVDTTRMEVGWAYSSFFELRKSDGGARPPGFRKKSMLSPLRYSHPNNGSVRIFSKRGATYIRLSMGSTRQDGVRRLTFRLDARPDIDLSACHLQNAQIVYDTASRAFEARLMVDIASAKATGNAVVGVDLGEDWLIAAQFSDGSRYLYSGRGIKSTRRYWQKVRKSVKPPSRETPRMSRRYRQISRKESRYVDHALHIISKDFVETCAEKGVDTICFGDLSHIRGRIRFGKRMNQRLHAWPFSKIVNHITYKAQIKGIEVIKTSEAYTSQTCPSCGTASKSNRKHRGWYQCRCGYQGHADLVGASNILQQVSGIPSSGCPAQPVVLVGNHHTVHEAESSRKGA